MYNKRIELVFAWGLVMMMLAVGCSGDKHVTGNGESQNVVSEESQKTDDNLDDHGDLERVLVGVDSAVNRPELPVYETGRYEGIAVSELVIVNRGKNIGDYQLGFYKPVDMVDEAEDFVGWMLIYDTGEFDDMWNQVKGKSLEEVRDLSEINGANQGYIAENFEWADGLGNTLNQGQRTFSGAEFRTGVYHFYVATVTEEGIVGLMEANEVVDVVPIAENVVLAKDDEAVKVTYTIKADERLKGQFIFFSYKDLYSLHDDMMSLGLEAIEELEAQGMGLVLYNEFVVSEGDEKGNTENNNAGSLVGTVLYESVEINKDIRSLENKELGKEVQGVFVLSFDEYGALGLGMANGFITPDVMEEAAVYDSGNGMGTLMLVGGGVTSGGGGDIDVFEAMKVAAGNEKPRLAIFSSSRYDFHTVYEHFYYEDPEFGSFQSNYEALGFEPVFIPLAVDNAYDIKNDPYWVSVVKSCHGAYLQGGDQYKHIRALLNDNESLSDMLLALEEMVDNGGVVGGTSAGMAAMGEIAYGYGYSTEAISHNEMEMVRVTAIGMTESIVARKENNNLGAQGIGLVDDDVIVDSHFDRRGRLGRLLVAMRDAGKTVGIGVDEGTAFVIENKIGSVVGDQGVFVLDGSEASYSKAGEGTIFGVENIKLHYLTAGDSYDFWSRNARQDKDKTPVEARGTYEGAYQVFASDYHTTKALIDFVNSEDMLLEMPLRLSSGETLTVAFEKVESTKAYVSKRGYEDELLDGYKQTFIEDMMVSVYQFKGEDVMPPEIGYMKSYTKPYKVYLGITDNVSGLDESSVNGETVKFISEVNTLYYDPFYDGEYMEIGIVISEDGFSQGDEVRVEGIMDMVGNVIEAQTWRYDSGTWVRVD